MNAIEARKLTCGYGRRHVLESLSLSVRAGEILVLLGPNGAGKTTLLRALARLLRPTAGEILLCGKDLWACRVDEAAQRVALMPQNERRDWPLTVEASVGLGRAPHRGWLLPYTDEDRQVVASALAATGLVELRDRPITELSGGEWRRMIFARALAQQASVLLLDEPTAGLDLKYQHEVLRLIRQMAAERELAVVLTLHDLNHAALYGDCVAVIAEHTIASLGSPTEVITAEVVSRVFGIRATVVPHPVYGTPLVAPLLEDAAATDAPQPTHPNQSLSSQCP
jgi:iron complex transport system ATP-binding protein